MCNDLIVGGGHLPGEGVYIRNVHVPLRQCFSCSKYFCGRPSIEYLMN